jgi:hypothetical protein
VEPVPYELNGSVGRSLISALAEEKQTLAGFRSPGRNVVGNIGNLIMLEGAHSLGVNRLGSEPEKLLGVQKVPIVKN